jgi:AcrR family transcriptional regulator
MPRPSRQLDQALLRSGRALFAAHGCDGLSQRLVAEHAGVQPGMFHYHFKNKDGFLAALLQQLYEEMFASLQAMAVAAPATASAPPRPAATRLRDTLIALAQFVREHRPLLLRLAADAAAGHRVVHDFARANAPRHLDLLMQLLAQLRAEGRTPPAEPLPQVVFLLGAVVAPLLVAPGMAALAPVVPGRAAGWLADAVQQQVCSDEAIAERADRALAAVLGDPRDLPATSAVGGGSRGRAAAVAPVARPRRQGALGV